MFPEQNMEAALPKAIAQLLEQAVPGASRAGETITFPAPAFDALRAAVAALPPSIERGDLAWLVGDRPTMHQDTARNLARLLGHEPAAIGL